MRKKTTALLFSFVALAWLSPVTPASGQGLGWFGTAGMGSIDYIDSRESAMQASGGGLLRLGTTRVSLGGQGDVVIKGGYATGRGGPLAQLDILPREAKVQPFVTGGYFFADGNSMWMVGGGVDVRFAGRSGLRLAVQDAFARATVVEDGAPSWKATTHEPSFQIGFVYR